MKEKIAFRMTLHPGQLDEYRRRHDKVWPELAALLKNAGIEDYSIHYDPETHHLFGVLWRQEDHRMDNLPDQEIMRRWWDYMADIMETEPDNKPVLVPLETVFHLP